MINIHGKRGEENTFYSVECRVLYISLHISKTLFTLASALFFDDYQPSN